MQLPGKGAHYKYLLFNILYITGIVLLFAFIVPGITRNQPLFLKIIIWSLVIISAIAIMILRLYIAKKDYKLNKQIYKYPLRSRMTPMKPRPSKERIRLFLKTLFVIISVLGVSITFIATRSIIYRIDILYTLWFFVMFIGGFALMIFFPDIWDFYMRDYRIVWFFEKKPSTPEYIKKTGIILVIFTSLAFFIYILIN